MDLIVPLEVRWALTEDLAALARSYPYRLRLIPRGERGVWVELAIYPHDTIDLQPVRDGACCHSCLAPDLSTL